MKIIILFLLINVSKKNMIGELLHQCTTSYGKSIFIGPRTPSRNKILYNVDYNFFSFYQRKLKLEWNEFNVTELKQLWLKSDWWSIKKPIIFQFYEWFIRDYRSILETSVKRYFSLKVTTTEEIVYWYLIMHTF